MPLFLSVLAILVAYLLGSISFAWIAGHLKGVDLRKVGSGNLGATNAGRVLGGRWFAFCFLGDLLKGLLPVLAARFWGGDLPAWLPVGVAAGAILGHTFTCFHGLRGGKAVATAIGVILGLDPALAGIAGGAWLAIWLVFWLILGFARSAAVGPASILGTMVLLTAILAWTGRGTWSAPRLPTTIFLLALGVLVLVRHISNVKRIAQEWRRRGGRAA